MFSAYVATYVDNSVWRRTPFTASRDSTITLYIARKSTAAARHSARNRQSFCSVRPDGDSSQRTRDEKGAGDVSGATTATINKVWTRLWEKQPSPFSLGRRAVMRLMTTLRQDETRNVVMILAENINPGQDSTRTPTRRDSILATVPPSVWRAS